MWESRRLITLLGVGAAAALAALVLPISAAHAADDGVAPGYGGGPYESCDGAVCLVMGEQNLNDWQYSGIRPYFTEWMGDQAYNVRYSQDGSAIDAGSYTIKVDDFWSTLWSTSSYKFGDFVPNAEATAGLDLGWFDDLSGATVYKTTLFDGAITNLSINNVGPHDATYWVFSTPDYTNTVVTAGGASADYIQYGDSDPVFLWNSLFHAGLPEAQVPDYLIPADPFSALDFNPCDFLGLCDAPL